LIWKTRPSPRTNPELIATFRTAAIKSFEYAYEISARLFKRNLAARLPAPHEIEQIDFRAMMRLPAEKRIIEDPLPWFQFRDKRNINAHTYNELNRSTSFRSCRNFSKKAAIIYPAPTIMPVHISEAALDDVHRILHFCLPPDVRVYAYGSRVHGRNLKPFSDPTSASGRTPRRYLRTHGASATRLRGKRLPPAPADGQCYFIKERCRARIVREILEDDGNDIGSVADIFSGQ
jgi:hypothetical protein